MEFIVMSVVLGLISTVYGDCDACIDSQCYWKLVLPGVGDNTGQIDWNTNTLYVIDSSKQEITLCNLDVNTCNKNPAKIWSLTRVTVNQNTGDVYGSVRDTNGIYKLDFVNNKMDLFVPYAAATHMAFQDKLYYVGSNHGKRGGFFTFENGVSRLIPGTEGQKVPSFVVDKNSDIYADSFSNPIYPLRVLMKNLFNHTKLWYSDYHATVDRSGNAIFFNTTSHAVYRDTNGELVEIGAVNSDMVLFPMFDRDNNLVCAFSGKFYHYKKVLGVSCTTIDVEDKRIIIESQMSTTTLPTTEFATIRAPDESDAADTGVDEQKNDKKETKHQCTCPNSCKVHVQSVFSMFTYLK